MNKPAANPRKALGKGLSALLPQVPQTAPSEHLALPRFCKRREACATEPGGPRAGRFPGGPTVLRTSDPPGSSHKGSSPDLETRCRVARGSRPPRALSRSGQGDFHHPALP